MKWKRLPNFGGAPLLIRVEKLQGALAGMTRDGRWHLSDERKFSPFDPIVARKTPTLLRTPSGSANLRKRRSQLGPLGGRMEENTYSSHFPNESRRGWSIAFKQAWWTRRTWLRSIFFPPSITGRYANTRLEIFCFLNSKSWLPSCRVAGYTFLESLIATLFSSKWRMQATGTTSGPTIFWKKERKKESKEKKKERSQKADPAKRPSHISLPGLPETNPQCGIHFWLSDLCGQSWAQIEGQCDLETWDLKKSLLRGEWHLEPKWCSSRRQPRRRLSWSSVTGRKRRTISKPRAWLQLSSFSYLAIRKHLFCFLQLQGRLRNHLRDIKLFIQNGLQDTVKLMTLQLGTMTKKSKLEVTPRRIGGVPFSQFLGRWKVLERDWGGWRCDVVMG